MIFDPDITIQPRYDHIVYDSIEKDRYPSDFLRKHVPVGLDWKDPAQLPPAERAEYLKAFRQGLEIDARTDRDIRNRIDDAIALAVKRARWNFKTAIPLYYPKANAISLLLPVALVDDNKVDLALVVTRTAAGSYSGETVYKLKWAYDHARLVCRPDSDWLTPKGSGAEDEEDEASDDEEGRETSVEGPLRPIPAGTLPEDQKVHDETSPTAQPPSQGRGDEATNNEEGYEMSVEGPLRPVPGGTLPEDQKVHDETSSTEQPAPQMAKRGSQSFLGTLFGRRS